MALVENIRQAAHEAPANVNIMEEGIMEMMTKTVENTLSGERITFRRIAPGTDDERFEGSIFLAPHGYGPPEHIHPIIEERFKVRSGMLSAKVGGNKRTYTTGEEFVVPPGTPHRWWNETGEEVVIDFVVLPALPLDRFLETVFSLAQAGKANAEGLPNILRMAVIQQKYWDVVYLARPPLPVQKVVLGIFSIIGRILGYRLDPYPYERAG